MFKNYYGLIFLTILLLIILFFPLVTKRVEYCRKCKNDNVEPFETLLAGKYPTSDETPILDSYPFTHYKVVDKDTYSSNSKHYPVFSLGSYEQITNNLRYYKNPDNGLCAPAELCGDFYHDIHTKSNIIKPLPPVCDGNDIRVNYYRTSVDLFLNEQPGTLVELPAF